MQIRWWNSFIILAAILIAIGFIGAITGARMVFDPGRVSSGKEWILYLVAGILMLINGLLPTTTGGNGGGAREDETKRNSKP